MRVICEMCQGMQKSTSFSVKLDMSCNVYLYIMHVSLGTLVPNRRDQQASEETETAQKTTLQ